METWRVGTPQGITEHDTEAAAEFAAEQLVKSGRSKVAVVYPIQVEEAS